MVRIYLVQHGESKPKEEDPERRLTEKGVEETEKVANALSNMGVKVARIFHSGKARAKMTAEILGKKLGVDDIIEAGGLNPLDDPTNWFEKLSKVEEDIMIVGHLPHLSKLTSKLLGVEDKEVVTFSYSGVLCLEKVEGWKITWFIKPENIK